MSKEISTLRRLADVVAEYDLKAAQMEQTVKTFEAAGDALKSASCVGGTWGNVSIDTGHIYERTLQDALLKSAWMHIYKGLQIERIASAKDKDRFQKDMQNPAPFTLENIRVTFGYFVADPWSNILRGLAEVFSDLDPAYKSHEKMKIGVSGLPKRIIMGGFGGYRSWGRDKLESVLNALAAYQKKPFVTYGEMCLLMKDENALLHDGVILDRQRHSVEEIKVVGRGIRLRKFANGNAHLFFEPDTLKDVNRALAEYYGEVLADCYDDDQPKKKRESTEVSKDLQYYPTPIKVVDKVVDDLYNIEGEKILEPSCGCGRFMDALRAKGADVTGIEYDMGRVEQCRAKGHRVIAANFLEMIPSQKYDKVIMNPPFYGKHYAKHVEHALKFLKPGGILIAILPITARYDHGALDHLIPKERWREPWSDLPFGSFRESGTNINTTVLMIRKPEK